MYLILSELILRNEIFKKLCFKSWNRPVQKVTVSNQDVGHEVTLLHVNKPKGLNNEFDTIVSDSCLLFVFLALQPIVLVPFTAR